MERTVDEKTILLAVFRERPQELIDRLESADATVFERNDCNGITLLILCEHQMTDLVIDMIRPHQDETWDPFSVEIGDIFATADGLEAEE